MCCLTDTDSKEEQMLRRHRVLGTRVVDCVGSKVPLCVTGQGGTENVKPREKGMCYTQRIGGACPRRLGPCDGRTQRSALRARANGPERERERKVYANARTMEGDGHKLIRWTGEGRREAQTRHAYTNMFNH